MWSMQGKEKLFDFGRIQTHDPTILITDGPNVLTRAMRNLSGFLPAQKFKLYAEIIVWFHYPLIVVISNFIPS